jgi:L-alanine-DL-glutamate epimerase-like enolase superfamily enzyme
MKITDVEPFVAGNPRKAWFFVPVRTDEGIIGVGERWLAAHTRPEIRSISARRAAVGLALKVSLDGDSPSVPTLANMVIRNFLERCAHAFSRVSFMSPKLSLCDFESQHVFKSVAEWHQQCR